MVATNRPHIRLRQGLCLLITCALIAPAALSLSVSAQQIGPYQPQPRPVKESGVTKAITKLFKKNEEEQADESEDSQVQKLQEGDKPLKPKVTPAAAEPPRAPVSRPPMLSQPPLTQAKIEAPEVDIENPPAISRVKLDDPSNPLGLADAENRLKHLMNLVDNKRYQEAKPGLVQLRQWLVDLTEAHIGLYKTLNQIPSARAQAELEKELALLFAQLRDRTMLEVARVYIAERDYPRAIKELTEVVKSQPRSMVGLRSYELLQEIGFTEKLQLAQ